MIHTLFLCLMSLKSTFAFKKYFYNKTVKCTLYAIKHK